MSGYRVVKQLIFRPIDQVRWIQNRLAGFLSPVVVLSYVVAFPRCQL